MADAPQTTDADLVDLALRDAREGAHTWQERALAAEVMRLRALVQAAYEEGCNEGPIGPRFSVAECWTASRARKELGRG